MHAHFKGGRPLRIRDGAGDRIAQRGSFNLASVYVALRRLEERGCVSSRTEMTDAARARMRVYYHLEPAAEAYLTEQKEEYRRTAVGVQNVLKSCEVQHEKEA